MSERHYPMWDVEVYGVGIEVRIRRYDCGAYRSEFTLNEAIEFASVVGMSTIVTVVE